LKKEKGKRGNNRGDKINQGALYAYMEISQQNPLYNYYILIKTLKKVPISLVISKKK
jgi:hypothetical protein